jgi:hypothetical protein
MTFEVVSVGNGSAGSTHLMVIAARVSVSEDCISGRQTRPERRMGKGLALGVGCEYWSVTLAGIEIE